MCGIVFGFNKKGKKISKSVMKRYENQKHRGQNGYGYVAFYKNRISVGRSVDEKGIRTQIMNEASGMIGYHHRMPTSTANVIEATHPIFVSNEELDHDYYVVHNGVIRNAEELKKIHEKLKYTYNTVIETETITHYVAKKTGQKYYNSTSKVEKFNDSEALAIELARMIDGMTRKIDAVGTIAFVAFKLNKETNKLISVTYGHNSGNPLTVTDNSDHFFLTSLGGTPIAEDVIFTLSTDGKTAGHTTRKDLNVGYISEQERARANMPQSSFFTSSNKTEDPALPFPKEGGIKRDIVPYKKNSKGTYEHPEDYLEDRLGYNSAKSLDWEEEGKKLTKIKHKAGFDLTRADEEMIDTTREERDFMQESTTYVLQYLEKQDELISLKTDIDTAEYMLQGEVGTKSRMLLSNEIIDYEKKIEVIQGELNAIEDAYYDDLGDTVKFASLVDAYIEQMGDDRLDTIQADDTDEEIEREEMNKAMREGMGIISPYVPTGHF